jgi:drug/metabolite transporter (DMT)-like permease
VLSGLVLPFTAGRKIPVGWEFYGCFHVGFLCNTLGVILWFLALKHGGTSLAGNLSLLGSFVSLLCIRLLRPDQEITWYAVAGLTLIVLGVALSRKPQKLAAPPGGVEPAG